MPRTLRVLVVCVGLLAARIAHASECDLTDARLFRLVAHVRESDAEEVPLALPAQGWLDDARRRDAAFAREASALVACLPLGSRESMRRLAENLRESGRAYADTTPAVTTPVEPCPGEPAHEASADADTVQLVVEVISQRMSCRLSALLGELRGQFKQVRDQMQVELVQRAQLEGYARLRRERRELLRDLQRRSVEPAWVALVELGGGGRAAAGFLKATRPRGGNSLRLSWGGMLAGRCAMACDLDGGAVVISAGWSALWFTAGYEEGRRRVGETDRRRNGGIVGIRSTALAGEDLQLGVQLSSRSGLGVLFALPIR